MSEVQNSTDSSEKTLKTLDFTDIYVDESGFMFMKGLNDPLYLPQANSEGLTGIPSEYMSEASLLVKRALAQNEVEKRASFPLEYRGMSFRITKINTISRRWITLRKLLDPVPRLQTFTGVPKQVIRSLAQMGRKGNSGLILFTGKTGSGKTTIACSLLQEYLSFFGDVGVTLERPAELKLDGPYGVNNKGWCFQTEVSSNGYSEAVENVMRYTPRFILFGEIRGYEEAKEALMLSNTGHLVIATMHSPSPIDAINRLVDLASEGKDKSQAAQAASRSLMAVFNQTMEVTPLGKVFNLTSLFFPQDDIRIRGMVAENATNQLISDIQRQKILIDNGGDPYLSPERQKRLREQRNAK